MSGFSCILENLGGADKINSHYDQRVCDTHEDPPARVFVSGLMLLISIVLFLCYHGDMLECLVYTEYNVLFSIVYIVRVLHITSL